MAVLRGSCGLGLNRPVAKDNKAECILGVAHLVFGQPHPAATYRLRFTCCCAVVIRHQQRRVAQEAAAAVPCRGPLYPSYDRRCASTASSCEGHVVEMELNACLKRCIFGALHLLQSLLCRPLRSSSHTSPKFVLFHWNLVLVSRSAILQCATGRSGPEGPETEFFLKFNRLTGL